MSPRQVGTSILPLSLGKLTAAQTLTGKRKQHLIRLSNALTARSSPPDREEGSF
jgi:hypothetical protein